MPMATAFSIVVLMFTNQTRDDANFGRTESLFAINVVRRQKLLWKSGG